MSATARLSLTNRWASASITGTAAVDAAHALDNVKTPERPLLTYRSTNTTNVEVIADTGSAQSAQLVVLSNVNFALAHFQANATNPTNAGLGSATFQSGPQAVRRDPWTGRYNMAFLNPAPFIFRWYRLFIPTQTPIDLASYFEVGGLFTGPLVEIPRGWRWGMRFEPVDPRLRVDAELGQWSNDYATGDRLLRIQATRQALIDEGPASWSVDDMLQEFLDVDREWVAAGFGAFYLNRGSTAHAWIMRARPEPWSIDYPACESGIALEEVLAG